MGDLDALARQYWNHWGEMMRTAAASAPPGVAGMAPGNVGIPGIPNAAGAAMPGWNEAVAWWTQLAKGAGAREAADTGVNEAIDRFNSQARGWFSQMQQVAAQAAPGASAADVADAWKRALGGQGDNPFSDMFRSMSGPGQHGFEHWVEQAAPFVQGFQHLQRDSRSMLGQPTFGFAREHQERWQQLALAQMDYQQHEQAYNALMGEAARNAFVRFEARLAERTEPGKQLDSARALFDLWIDAAEDAYAQVALSERFREAFGAKVNSQMRLRAALQAEIEQVTQMLGIPTRTEVDAAHRKIVQLEREMRRVRDALDTGNIAPRSGATVAAATVQAERSARTGKRPAKPVIERTTTSRQGLADKAIARKAAVSQPAVKKVAVKTGNAAIRTPADTKARPVAKQAVATAAAKRAATKRVAAKRAAVAKTAVKKAAVRKAAVKKIAADKTSVRKTAVKKTAVKKTAINRPAAKKAPAKKALAGKSVARNAVAKKAPGSKAAPAGPASRSRTKAPATRTKAAARRTRR